MSDLQVLGTHVVDDWRWRGEPDNIITLLFWGKSSSMTASAKDDIEEVKWFKFELMSDYILRDEHKPLFNKLKEEWKKKETMETVKYNPILGTDSYKISHWVQYPKDAEIVYSYLCSRGGMFNKTLFTGLQGILKQHFVGQVFGPWNISDAAIAMKKHFGSENRV